MQINWSKVHFQLELSLAQYSPSLFWIKITVCRKFWDDISQKTKTNWNIVCENFKKELLLAETFWIETTGNSNERPGRQKVSVEIYNICPFCNNTYTFLLPLNCLIGRKCGRRIKKLSARAWFFKNFLATRLPGCHTFSTSAPPPHNGL